MRLIASSLVLLCSISSAATAKADDFTLTGSATTITFSLPSSLVPNVSVAGIGFLFNNVAVDVNGTTHIADVGFGSVVGSLSYPDLFIGDTATVTSGGTSVGVPSYVYLFGPQLYSGPESSPTLLPGPYVANDLLAGNAQIDMQISSSAVPSTVPEPASLLLMGTGLLGVFAETRRRILQP